MLDLGCGGGHVAAHLKDRFRLTLVDISEEMIEVSRRLNPGCEHVRGDMRSVRLGRAFDAVLVHDAADYITTEADLRLVLGTAAAHCRPAGLALFAPDHLKDDFRESAGRGGGGDPSGAQASFTEVTWDPDPADDWIRSDYEFTLRGADGAVQVVRESHRLGAFSLATWERLLREAGFDPAEPPAGAGGPGARPPAHLILGRRPGRG